MLSLTTSSVEVDRWEDEPEFGRSADEWPYPTRYVKSLIEGELADRIRERLGLEDDVPVYITETVISGGWSEYTQETDYTHVVEAGWHEIELGYSYWGNGLGSLLKWLDEVDEVEKRVFGGE